MQNTQTPARNQNLIVFYVRTLLYTVMALLLRVLTFAPLYFLFAYPAPSNLRWLALLCPVLFVFFLLPLRFSFADALVQPTGQRRFAFDTAFGLRQYGEKFLHGLLHALNIIKWSIPLAVAGYYIYSRMGVSSTDVLAGVMNIGAWVGTFLSNVANTFNRIFGIVTEVAIKGGLVEGLMTIGVGVGVCLLILLIGTMRNSATRYVWAYANHSDRKMSTENRRRVKNRRFVQLLFALLNLLLWVPLLYDLSLFLPPLIDAMWGQILSFLSTQVLDFTFLSASLGQFLFAFFVLYLPLLPLRRMITAYYAAKTVASRPAAEQTPTPVAADDLPPAPQERPEPVPAWPVQNDPVNYTTFHSPSAAPEEAAPVEEAAEAQVSAPSFPWETPVQAAPKVTAEPTMDWKRPVETVQEAEPEAETPVEAVAAPVWEATSTAPVETAAAVESAPAETPAMEEPPAQDESLFGGKTPPQDVQEIDKQDTEPPAFTLGQ